MTEATGTAKAQVTINGRRIGAGEPAYIIAEMSANHGQDFGKAKEIIHAMKEAGADAVKIQTYTPDTVTIDCDNPYFVDCLKGTIWEGQSLYALYGEAFTPWEWQPELKALAESLGIDFFSTPIGEEAVSLLQTMDVPAYKVSSFEIVHLPLIRMIAATGKPMIISTGMATKEEIQDALKAAEGAAGVILLKCTSAYPAKIDDANLRTIPSMAAEFHVPVGLSDHTMGHAVPVAAITQGACVVEKHFVLSREHDKGPDSTFSMEPSEFRAMVDAVRRAEKNIADVKVDERALGEVRYGTSSGDKGSTIFRPSIFVVQDMAAGEEFTKENTRIIRPGNGLKPKHFEEVLGKKAAHAIARGTPVTWECVS